MCLGATRDVMTGERGERDKKDEEKGGTDMGKKT